MIEWVNANMEIVVTVFVFLVEFILRTVKTEKPRSLLYTAADGLKKVADILSLVSSLLDKVVQRVKSDEIKSIPEQKEQ